MLNDAWEAGKLHVLLPDGGKVAVIDTGGNLPVLLLLHGYTDSSRSYALITPQLRSRYRLIVPDLPGHGSSAATGPVTIESLECAIVQLMDVLGIHDCHLLGHSMGSMIALRLAAREKHIFESLICLAPSLRPRFGPESTLARAITSFGVAIDPEHPFFDTWYDDRTRLPASFLDAIRNEAAAMQSSVWNSLYADMERLDLSLHVSRLAQPTLAIFGKDDPLFGEADRKLLRQAMPNAVVEVLEGRGHNPHWEAPAHVAGLINAWLAHKVHHKLRKDDVVRNNLT